MSNQFLSDVQQGLSGNPKTLPSKYFYDKQGDELFMKIMHLPEYYLTRAELEIFLNRSQEIIDALQLHPSNYFELIELGAGDGLKTKELLRALLENKYCFDFCPIDISENALTVLEKNVTKELPDVSVKKMQGDYFGMLDALKKTQHPKVILFLGSNIGNMGDEQAGEFLKLLGQNLCPGDKLLLGVDLIKPASVVLPAYNDAQGVTREFNLNLLRRINNELDANFDMEAFDHVAEYSEADGCARSYLKSTKSQQVKINGRGATYTFQKGERVQTEISRKYNDHIINKLIKPTSFKMMAKITDGNGYFANYVFEVESEVDRV